MVPARSSRHGISCSRHLSRSQAEIPLIPPVQISRASSPLLALLLGHFQSPLRQRKPRTTRGTAAAGQKRCVNRQVI
ncbi:hypothetical protein CQZ93_15225 [Ochrobactrum vermis]|nr:hypothetical protein CQZ93_15225 [Ochrobactrum vermis]